MRARFSEAIKRCAPKARCVWNFLIRDFDIRLDRFTKLSQVGLLVLTIVIFKFTVIPIYQRDSLEEAIAQKETELTNLQITIQQKTFLIDWIKYLQISSLKCGSLMIGDDADDDAINWNEESFGGSVWIEKFWDLNVSECMLGIFNDGRFTKLSPEIISRLKLEIKAFGEKSNAEKREMKIRFDALPEFLRNHPDQIQEDPESMTKQMSDVLGISPHDPKYISDRIREQQLKIINNYSVVLQRNLAELRTQDFLDRVFRGVLPPYN